MIADAAAPTVTPRKLRREVVKGCPYRQNEIRNGSSFLLIAAKFNNLLPVVGIIFVGA
jgi:hypothetical protein